MKTVQVGVSLEEQIQSLSQQRRECKARRSQVKGIVNEQKYKRSGYMVGDGYEDT